MKNALAAFHEQFTDSKAMPDTIRAVLKKKINIDVLSQKYEYAFLLNNNFAVDALFNNKKVEVFSLPEPLINTDHEVPFDTELLQLGMRNYTYLLEKYVERSVIFPFYIGKTQADLEEVNAKMPLIVDSLLRAHQFPGNFQDYFLAKNVDSYMIFQGISPNVDNI
jgi:hypothetical protein